MRAEMPDKAEISERDYREVSIFLFTEARLLDNGRFKEWLECLTHDVTYRLIAPTLSMSRSGDQTPAREAILMHETFGSLTTRVHQLSNPTYTVSENPRSFSRRHVANILIDSIDDVRGIQVQSNVLLYRSRGSQMAPHLYSMARRDELRFVDGKLYLAKREAILDESVVDSRNITALF